ncbi:MAG: cytosine permease [Microbacteriaceae bacterium]|nr:cytosine permease [Microbacteriaceae bacterium]
MVDDDNRADSDLDPDTVEAELSGHHGPRRSTWAPPPTASDATISDTSDDELARALEEDFERITHTGTLPIVDKPAPNPEADAPIPIPIPIPIEPEPEPTAGVILEPPARLSLPTNELAATLAERASSGDDTGEIMAQLEEQLRLRQQDAAEFRRWQESRVAEGGAGALAEIESVLEGFHDIVDSETPVRSASGAAPEPVVATHKFNFDEVLDSDLHSAPAPRTAPVSDIPPPPGLISTPMSETVPPPSIPDLVEPTEAPVSSGSFDFDALIVGAASATDGVEEKPETEQVFADWMEPLTVRSEEVAIVPETPSPAFEPITSSQAVNTSSSAIVAQPVAPPAFRVEESSVQPTAAEQRVGRASRLFWLWFAANSSVVSLAFGGAVLSLGMSLRQAIVATLIGVSVSFLPLGLGTLAGKWSGQPTMIVSRATFGHLGNILPASLAIIVRVFWGAVLLWFLAAGTARILIGAELAGPLSESQVMIIGLAVGFLLALVIAFFGYGLIARIQMVFTIISALLIAGLIVITWPAVDIPAALTLGDGPWILVLTGAVLVFSFVGLVWAVSSADLARYQRSSGSGAASILWSTFGATIPAFVLIAYGAVLAASNPDVALGLVETPLDTIGLLIPIWYPIPLIAALAFSLLSGVVISIYSGGFALQATGVSMRRAAAVVIVGVAVAALAVLIAVSVGDFALILRDVATSLAVPIAAWAGIFGAEMMIRNKRFVSESLVTRGGMYADFRWLNLSMLIVATAIGFGLTTASVSWLGWQGYLFGIMGVPLSSDLAGTDLGVFVALVIGIFTPIIAGIPGIRRQEVKSPQRSQAVAV